MALSSLQKKAQLQRLARLRRRELRERLGQIYIAEAIGTGRAKIGFSINALKRLRSVAVICPAPLRLLALIDGPESLEKDLHRRFAEEHSHGEWFDVSPRLETFIRKNMVRDPMLITCSKSPDCLSTQFHKVSPF